MVKFNDDMAGTTVGGRAKDKLPTEEILRRAVILGIAPSRALFLSSCPHHSKVTHKDPIVTFHEQIVEACRLGLSVRAAAPMLGMSEQALLDTCLPFAESSEIRILTTAKNHNLMAPEQPKGRRFRRRNK